jgi:hypothetical protein
MYMETLLSERDMAMTLSRIKKNFNLIINNDQSTKRCDWFFIEMAL